MDWKKKLKSLAKKKEQTKQDNPLGSSLEDKAKAFRLGEQLAKELNKDNTKSENKDKKINLTEVKPGMSEEEIYQNLLKVLKKQGIKVKKGDKE